MKKLLKMSWMACLAVVLFTGSVVTVKAEGAGEDSVAGKAIKMKEKLGLTDEQVTKLKALVESERAIVGPMVKQQLADLKTLGVKTKAKAPDAELSPILDKLESGHRSLQSERNKYVDQARAILNPTQQAKITLYIAAKRLSILKHLYHGKK